LRNRERPPGLIPQKAHPGKNRPPICLIDPGMHDERDGHHDGDNDSAKNGHNEGGGDDRLGEGHHGKDGDRHDRDERRTSAF
jgi:hypothetical protein